jgi:hypothetical protein
MDLKKKDKIVNLLIPVIQLLARYEKDWSEVMRGLLDNYVNLTYSATKKEAALLIMKSMLGGMGSLSDLILYKDGKMLIEENDQLDDLLDELYVECKNLQ